MSKITLRKRERIAAAAREIARWLAQSLSLAGLNAGIKFNQSKRTGSVYLKIRILAPSGQRIKNAGAQIRISDHRRPGDRWANFSQPARRFYGIWVASSPWKIVGKVERITRQIRNRLWLEGGEA